MKTIHKITSCIVMAFTCGNLCAQTKPEESKDTMHILLNGEKISITVPKEGNKTTISLEDSASIIQISVGKVSKFKTMDTKATQANTKYIRWFGELELGMSTVLGRSIDSREQVRPESVFQASSNTYVFNNRVWIGSAIAENRYTGLHLGFSIREKRRPFLKSELTLITGSRFRFTRFVDKGMYESRMIKATQDSGVFTYYRDSVYSVRNDSYRSSNNSYLFLFPFMLEKNIGKDFRIAMGVQVGLGFQINRFKTNFLSFGSSTAGSAIQFQPMIKMTYKRVSLYISTKLGKFRLETETMHTISGIGLNCGLAYRLY